MTEFFSPRLLDAFLERIIEVLPDGATSCAPDCASLGRTWTEKGLRPGDLVLLCLPNGKELLHQFFGVLMAQGVPALLTPLVPAARLREIADTMGARAIAALRLPSGDLGADSYDSIGRLQIALLPPTPEPAASSGEVVLMSSGTSGFASGCVFDFEQILTNAQRHADAIGHHTDDVVLLNLPLFFSFALSSQALGSLVQGNQLIISGPPFNLNAYRKTLADYDVTISSLTPVLICSILESDPSVLAKLKTLSVGGDVLAPDLVARLIELRKGRELYLTYGLTQAGPRVATLAAHNEPASRYSSVGLPLAGTTVSLRPTSLGPSDAQRNQLYVTSETVMKRTLGRVEGRSQHNPTERNTIATGDAFHQDEDGYLYFRGRLSDFISRRGEKISLAGVRRLAMDLPHVVTAKTIVVQLPDGSEDFDLELRVDSPALGQESAARLYLSRLLRRTEMPRKVHVEPANEMTAQRYK